MNLGTGERVVDETINAVVLRLLGITDVSDIDYDTYRTLLKERLLASRMVGASIPPEEDELLRQEYNRVRNKTGRFKATAKRVSFGSLPGRAKPKQQAKPNQRMLPGTAGGALATQNEKAQRQAVREDKKSGMGMMEFLTNVVSPSLSRIEASLQNILFNLASQTEAERKTAEKNRRAGEKTKKRGKEEKREGGGSLIDGFKGVAKKALAPVTDMMGGVFKFIKNVLLGIVALKLVDFLKDPMGFFRPMINGIIGFANMIIRGLFNFVMSPFNLFIGALNLSIQGLVGAINNTIGLIPGVPKIEFPEIPTLESPQIPYLQAPPDPNEPEPKAQPVPTLAGGGAVTGSSGQRVTGAGSDTQLVALSPGEVVMSRPAVEAYGADTLLGMNAMAGGTNMPGMAKVRTASGGGLFPTFSGGGIVEHLHGEPGRTGYRADHGTLKQAHDHYGFSSEQLRLAVQRDLAAGRGPSGRKYQIGTTQRDGDPGYHGVGRAFDIPWAQFGSGAINENDFKQSRQLDKDVRALVAKHMGTTGAQGQDNILGNAGGGGVGTTEQRKMLDAISFAEGTPSYGTIFGGKVVPELAQGKLTIDQVHEMMMTGQLNGKNVGYGSGSYATGKYQWMPDTLRDVQRSMGLPGSTLFTNRRQDEMILNRISRYRGVTPELLKKEGMSQKVLDMLAPEFASFPYSPNGGGSYYPAQRAKSAEAIRKAYGESAGKGAGTGTTSTSSSSGSYQFTPEEQAFFDNYDARTGQVMGQGLYNSSNPADNPGRTVNPGSAATGSMPIVSPGRLSTPPGPPRSGANRGGAIAVPVGPDQPTSASTAGANTQAPMFDSQNRANPDIMVVQSIYNMVAS